MDDELFERVRTGFAKLCFSKDIKELHDLRNTAISFCAMTEEQRKTLTSDMIEILEHKRIIKNFQKIEFEDTNPINKEFFKIVKGFAQ